METYMEYKKRTSDELEAFPIAFAFSNKQFEEGLAKLNATKDECCAVQGGGFIRKADSGDFFAMFERHTKELCLLMEQEEFLTSAIQYELANHEYCITGDPDDALAVLGLDYNNLTSMQMLCFERAQEQYERSVVTW